MHESSFDKIVAFRDKYLDKGDELNIVDLCGLSLGDKVCNHLFKQRNWIYKAVSVESDDWSKDIKAGSVDVIVSGQTISRVKQFWSFMDQIGRILSPGGYLCLVAPTAGQYGESGDFYRFSKDGLEVLAKITGLEVVECNPDVGSSWWDTTLIAKKPGKKAVKRPEKPEKKVELKDED